MDNTIKTELYVAETLTKAEIEKEIFDKIKDNDSELLTSNHVRKSINDWFDKELSNIPELTNEQKEWFNKYLELTEKQSDEVGLILDNNSSLDLFEATKLYLTQNK